MITAGFAETGEEGQKLQAEIQHIVKENGITMMGPNCLGLINPWHKLNASFGQALGAPGSIALISQSGALIAAIQDLAASNEIGFSVLASLGNKATLDEVEFLENLQSDPYTKVISAYLEDISRGQEFMRVAEKVNKTKPVIILKAGRTAGEPGQHHHIPEVLPEQTVPTPVLLKEGVIKNRFYRTNSLIFLLRLPISLFPKATELL